MKDSEYNKVLIERYEDRLKETKEKKAEGKKPKKNETSFSNQIKGLNDKLKELRSRDKENEGTETRKMNEEDEKEMGMNKGGAVKNGSKPTQNGQNNNVVPFPIKPGTPIDEWYKTASRDDVLELLNRVYDLKF